jgi:hypothetical protein
VVVNSEVILAGSLACAPISCLHQRVALLVQLVETRQLLQVCGVVERLEEHWETFFLVRLDDLETRHAIKNQSETAPTRWAQGENKISKWTHSLAAPSALLVLLARNEDVAELAQVPADLVRYKPEDARTLALLLAGVPGDGFGIVWRCGGI